MGADFSAVHAAACAANMPDGSALRRAQDPSAAFTQTQHILWLVLQALARKRIPYPWERGEDSTPKFKAMPRDEFDRWYASKFKKED